METSLVPIVVYDLATIRFRRSTGGASMRMVAGSGEVLAVVDTLAHTSDEDAVFACCEHALAAARPRRNGRRVAIGLYNPYTAQLSYGAGGDCIVYGDRQPIALDSDGSLAHLVADGIEIDGRLIAPLVTTLAGVTRSMVDSEQQNRR